MMKARHWRDLGILFLLALAARLVTAWLLRQPGYTDAYYYAVGAQQLYTGQGLSEPFIWNYLDPPASVPHPGYQYWMPLTAMLGWLGMVVLGPSFWAMQAPFVLLTALLPLVAYGVAWDLTGERKHALLAGLLAVVPGFYAHLFVLPDNFAPFALVGSVSLWAAGRGLRDRRSLWFGLAGLAAGAGHLSRADGLLLAAIAVLASLLAAWTPDPASGSRLKPALACAGLALAGYLVVMAPWFVRNWLVFGTPLAGAGLKTLFLTDYDDLFAYHTSPSLARYLEWGWGSIFRSKAQALLLNLQRLWIENLLVVLLPFSALGLWRLRREPLLWPFLLYFPLLFLAMTLAFTFPGMRGGLFHSGGALLPFLFATAGPGLEVTLRWLARWRGWHVRRAWPVFAAALAALAALLAAFGLWRAGAFDGTWNERDQGYAEIGAWLAAEGAAKAVVMVGDAPAFTWHTGHLAVAIPNEPLDTVLAVADRYSARYLVLDSSRPRTTDALYAGQTAPARLELQRTIQIGEQTWQVYEVSPR